MAPFDLNGWGVGAQDVGWPTPTPTVGLAEGYGDGHSIGIVPQQGCTDTLVPAFTGTIFIDSSQLIFACRNHQVCT